MYESERPSSILDQMSSSVGGYLPLVLGALLVLLLGIPVALLLARGARVLVLRTGLDERIARALGRRRVGRLDAAGAVGRAVLHAALVVVVLSALHTLRIPALAGPLDDALAGLLAFVPRLFGALLLAVFAWLVARSARGGVATALGQRVPFVGEVAYWLVLVVFLPAVITVLGVERALSPVVAIVDQVLELLPKVVAVVIVMALAHLVGRGLSTVAMRALQGAGFDEKLRALGVAATGEERGGKGARWVGGALYGGVLLLGAVEATETLGLDAAALLLNDLVVLLGRSLLALALFGAAAWSARWAAETLSSSAVCGGRFLGVAARAAVLLLGAAFALEALGLDTELLTLFVGVSLGAVALGFALAVGLGGREVAGRELERIVRRLHADTSPSDDGNAPTKEHRVVASASPGKRR